MMKRKYSKGMAVVFFIQQKIFEIGLVVLGVIGIYDLGLLRFWKGKYFCRILMWQGFEDNEETIFDFTTGNEEKITKYTAVVCENPKIEAYAEIDQSLFRADPIYREGSLAHYIKRTFGAEGMRHLFALLIGLDENFRQGYFPWSVNEHLERMGYKRKANRTVRAGSTVSQ
ncbi:hypothetical protein LCGC14_3113630 [marine sediment metagenome]|uniref:Uncharacterized protein n=1 Tax=marine sediment metagenome TaxID=412755 RepID=A0A0F8YUA7_9ZZZZ